MIIDANIEIPFHQISLEDVSWYKEKEKEDFIEACDGVFGSIFLWSDAYLTELAKIANCAVVRYFFHGQKMYSYPIGGTVENRKLAMETLMKLSAADEEKLNITLLSDRQRAELSELFHGEFLVLSCRERFDYVYDAEKLATLKGKKLAAKRNHINRFTENNEWRYEKLAADNLEKCWEMELAWFDIRANEPEANLAELESEKRAIRKALDLFETLQFTGGILYAGDKVVAFTLGEKLNDNTMVVHFEKAFPDIQGAFQMINREFVNNNCEGCDYINREEDTGDLGLRKAKMSYYPDSFTKKYYAVQSEIVFAEEADEAQIISIWNTCFGDGDDYIRFFLRNRFTDETILCRYEDGKIVSMASLLPAVLKDGESETEIFYVYAVATLPEYRRRGYASDILQYAYSKWKKPLVLQPASEPLNDYYKKHGFEQAFENKLLDFTFNDLEENPASENTLDSEGEASSELYQFLDIDAEVVSMYCEKREAFLSDLAHVSWDAKATEYALNENAFVGGALIQSGDELVLFRMENNAIRIVEALVSDEQLQSEKWQKIFRTMCKERKCHIVWAHNHGGMFFAGANRTQTILEKYKLDSKKGYLGLTLD